MSSPKLAPSLAALRAEVDKRWPDRSIDWDGDIGDAAHRARTSEHNPDADGIIRAVDITADGINVDELLAAAIRDDRVHYVIHDGKIYSRTHGWAARPYTGASNHKHHVHISIRNNTSEKASATTRAKAAADTRSWFAPTQPPTPTPNALTTVSLSGLIKAAKTDPAKPDQTASNWAAVAPVERALVAEGLLARDLADGHYGTATKTAYKAWQKRCGYSGRDADGIPGRASLTLLGRRHGFKVVN